MKKILLILVAFVALCSCENTIPGNKVWDISPLNIQMYVQDTEGNDLLSPDFEGNILDDSIYVTYHDLKCPLGVDMSEETMTRAYLAVLIGLHYHAWNGENRLVFGEFDGAQDWDDSLKIHWGDGSSDEISFTHNFSWAIDGSPKISNQKLFLNGKEVKDKLLIVR